MGETVTSSGQAGRIFVGRQREMGELTTALESSVSGRGRLVLLAGEPGIGKTRTAQELAQEAEARGVEVIWGRCYEEEGSPPFWPWVQVIRSYVERRDPGPLQLVMGAGAADIGELLPEILQKLPGLEPAPALSPEAARFRLFDSITRFLKAAGRSQPLVLVLDDIHWADEPSLQLLQFVARELEDSCVMVLGCYRDVELSRQHPLSDTLARISREAVYQWHLLRGLDRNDTANFIESAAGTNVSRSVVEAVFTHTEGNPFFTTEVIQLLSDRGELAEVTVGGPEGIRIPEGVREVIGQRLNRLSGDCNQVLSTAAVIGREFTVNLLNRLIEDLSEDKLLEVLEEALAARLIEELPPNVGLYQFTHRLVQEALIQELSLTRRVRLHARIGGVLEDMYEAALESHSSELAYHFSQSEAVTGSEKVVEYSIMAGEQAIQSYACEEAEVHFRRALTSWEEQATDAEPAEILYGLAQAVAATGGRSAAPEALGYLERAFQYYLDAGDVARAVEIAEYPVDHRAGTTAGMSDFISRALSMAPPDSQQEGRLLSTYALARYKETGDYDRARDVFNRALVIARQQGDLALEMRVLADASEAAWWHLSLPEAVEYGRKVVELSAQVDDPRAESQARTYLERATAALGDAPAARRGLSALLAHAERLRAQPQIIDALARNAEIGFFTGDWEAALDFCDRGLALAGVQPYIGSVRALLEYERGAFAEGWSHMEGLAGFVSRTSTELTGFR
ncbi:MAG: hypothetical protein BZY87_02770 [SAR202 cluster bacterium Io17-Chloro-G6]|nr:MAG: hypothetical protein BZY87_02770 [SAR202 cluster bacterium Io17-Chloro-G6]